jgi:hypothetical protein
MSGLTDHMMPKDQTLAAERRGNEFQDGNDVSRCLVGREGVGEKENCMVSMIRTGNQYFQMRSEFVIPAR